MHLESLKPTIFPPTHVLIVAFISIIVNLALILINQLNHSLIMSQPPIFAVPSVDENDYKLITLDNCMQCLLISDKTTEKAAAAVDVRVGSLSDPEDLPGLAHFLEHMLFYSSEKYPKEDEYSQWISEHGGHTNAYTASTCFSLSLFQNPLP